jgi:hypothetical protein
MRFLDARRMLIAIVDLPSFIEQETGATPKGNGVDRAKCLCPLHGDTDASFSMVKHDDGWGFHCFGCQAKGTVVEFYKEYYGIDSSQVALEMICEKVGLTDEAEMLKEAIKNVATVDLDYGKRVIDLHLAASYQCQSLVRMNTNPDIVRWVNKAYREMNNALEHGDYATLEMIYDRASEHIEDSI